MGTPKLLLPWGHAGGTVVEAVLAAWRASRVERVVVVTHPDDRRTADICRAAGADVFVAPTAPPDMKASIRFGLEYVAKTVGPAEQDAWLVAPADLPLLQTATIDRVIAAYEQRIAAHGRGDSTIGRSVSAAAGSSEMRAVRPRHAGKFGHPALWPWRAIGLVAGLPDDRGLDGLLEQTGFDVVECDADAVGSDIDTPDEYRRLRDRYDRNDA
jgi:CTP:molybdopterin cytidylyltransferase MocA